MGTYNSEHKGEEKKVCVCCKKEKVVTEFYRSADRGRQSYCIECAKVKGREAYRKKKESVKERKKADYKMPEKKEEVSIMYLKNKELNLSEGQKLYLVNKRGETPKQIVDIYPVVVDKIYPYCIIVVDKHGFKIGITRACAALDLKNVEQIAKMRKAGVIFS